MTESPNTKTTPAPGGGLCCCHVRDYPTQSDTAPGYSSLTDPNQANFAPGYNGSSNPKVTAVGSFANSASYYGTFDQGGNLYEWVNQTTDDGDAFAKGGGWAFGSDQMLASGYGNIGQYTLFGGENDHNGFRIVATEVPEPGLPAIACIVGLCGLFLRRR